MSLSQSLNSPKLHLISFSCLSYVKLISHECLFLVYLSLLASFLQFTWIKLFSRKKWWFRINFAIILLVNECQSDWDHLMIIKHEQNFILYCLCWNFVCVLFSFLRFLKPLLSLQTKSLRCDDVQTIQRQLMPTSSITSFSFDDLKSLC